MFILSNELILTPSKQGGSKTQSSSHAHTTGDHTLTINEIPSHNHTLPPKANYGGSRPEGHTTAWEHSSEETQSTSYAGGGQPHNHGNTGSSTVTTNIVQPYITTYFWKRTV